MEEAPGLAQAPELVWLRRLVTVLTVTMIIGIATITVILWIRLSPSLPALPEALRLPEGETAAAVTFARDFTVVVTTEGRILVYDASGTLRRDVLP